MLKILLLFFLLSLPAYCDTYSVYAVTEGNADLLVYCNDDTTKALQPIPYGKLGKVGAPSGSSEACLTYSNTLHRTTLAQAISLAL